MAGHVKVAKDALADSWRLHTRPARSMRLDATWKGRGKGVVGGLVSRLVGEAEELIIGRPGEKIGSNDDENVPA